MSHSKNLILADVLYSFGGFRQESYSPQIKSKGMCVIEENYYLKVLWNLRGLIVFGNLILTEQINIMKKSTPAAAFPPTECWLSSPALCSPLLSSHCYRFICELAPYRPTGHLEPVALWPLGRVKYGN